VQYETATGTHYAKRAIHCALNRTNCAENFINSYPTVGNSRKVLYCPWNPDEVVADDGYSVGMMVALILPALYLLWVLVASVRAFCTPLVYDVRQTAATQKKKEESKSGQKVIHPVHDQGIGDSRSTYYVAIGDHALKDERMTGGKASYEEVIMNESSI
jgi:hypothetical protein